MSRRFVDRTVIVTGASAGIGLSCARKFAEEGANVVLVARGKAELDKRAAELARLGPVATVAADVADPAGQDRIVATAAEKFGAIHILVNNAGMNTRGPLEDHAPEDLGKVVDINLRAPITLTRRVLPYLRKAGRGAIVNVASLAGRVPLAHEVVYSATKFGLRTFSIALAEELRGTGITVSAVSPGPVDTNFIMGVLDDVPDIVLSQPVSTADEIADLVLACAADGKVERATPRVSAALTTLGYVAPGLRRVLRPLLEAQGRRRKRNLQRGVQQR
ncbi:MAG TPA: SDR family oxidoreductase [Kofleriaceae bacterium]|nr:SDR family oxidoreductase [Kofleriaceae bacterium]